MARGLITTEFTAPEQGARADLAPHRLPDEAVPMTGTQNVVVRDGTLVNRPGLAQFNATAVGGRPMGGALFETGASKFTVIGTTTKLKKLNAASSGYDDLTGTTAPTGSSDDPWRFVVFPTSTDNLIGTNKANTPQTWDGVAATFSDLGGSPPRAGDITVAANRVILADTVESGVAKQYRVRWSGFNNHASWDSLDFADLSDTSDVMVGCRALSRVAFAVYKAHSQWVGLAQTGQFPFKFELQDLKPGPVGPAAIVVAEGRHYYLAVDGSIYVFDGIRTTHVGDPIRRFLLGNFNFSQPRRCFGYYSRRDRDIYWWFTPPGTDDPAMGISLQIDTGRFFPHVFRKASSCGFEGSLVSTVTWDGLGAFTWDNIAGTYPTWNSFGSASLPVEVVGGTDGVIRQFGVASTDDGSAPSAKWRFQSRQPGGVSERTRVESLDSFFSVASAAQTVTVKVGSTDTLGTDPNFPAELTDTFDVGATDALRQSTYATDSPGAGTGTPEARFVTISYELDTVTDWTWQCAHLRSYTQRTSSP
jgi:hypothetical protein